KDKEVEREGIESGIFNSGLFVNFGGDAWLKEFSIRVLRYLNPWVENSLASVKYRVSKVFHVTRKMVPDSLMIS
ncbi:hypothetical protein QZH41_014077, partial [Actinostola sp. cb2023]